MWYNKYAISWKRQSDCIGKFSFLLRGWDDINPSQILKLVNFIWARDGMYTYWSQKPMPERDCVVEHVAPTTKNHTLIKYIIIFISVTIYIMVRWIKTDIILTDGVRGNTFCKSKWVTGSSPVQSNIGNEFHTENVGVGSRKLYDPRYNWQFL